MADEAIFLAEVAEMTGRFDDMRWHVNCFIKWRLEESQQEAQGETQKHSLSSWPNEAMQDILSEREMNLMSAAYKSSLASRRTALNAMKSEEKQNLDDDKMMCVKEYCERVVVETVNICTELLGILTQVLLKTRSTERIVLFQKMQGDYYRHLANVQEGAAKTKSIAMSHYKYDQAEILAQRDLEITNPIRLAVALNYSYLIAEVDGNQKAARRKARQSYSAALEELDQLEDHGIGHRNYILFRHQKCFDFWATKRYVIASMLPRSFFKPPICGPSIGP